MLSKDILERMKLSLEILAFLTLLFVVGLVYWNGPAITAKIQTVLQSSGFRIEEVNFFIFKLKVVDSLALAEKTTKELEETRVLVACLHEKNCSAPQVERSAVIATTLLTLNRSSENQRQSFNETILQSEKVVLQTERPVIGLPTVMANMDWIVLVGADRTPDGANDEVKRLKSASIANVAVLSADGWFRTVVGYPTQTAAVSATPQLAGIVKRQPYVRNFKDWCVGATWAEWDDKARNPITCGGRK